MVASMTRNLPSRGPHSHPARGVIFATALWRGVMATLVVTLSLVTGLSPAPVAAAPPARVAAWAPACPPARTVADSCGTFASTPESTTATVTGEPSVI